MNRKVVLLAAMGAAAFGSSRANAQQQPQIVTTTVTTTTTMTPPAPEEHRSYFTQHVPAPVRALELTVGTGYTQGFGQLQEGVSMTRVATPGIAVNAGIGYRFNPRWQIGLTGEYQELAAQRSTGARGMVFSVGAQYHFAPYVRSDPWIGIGSGYRMLWEESLARDGSSLLTHGAQLAKLTAGFDVRVAPDVAIAPVIGADLNVFSWQDGAAQVAIENPRISTFVFAGVQGRFNLSGGHEVQPGVRTAQARR